MLFHQLPVDAAFARLRSGPTGLSHADAAARRLEFGPNRIERLARTRHAVRFLRQFTHFFAALLWIAALLALIADWWMPGQGMAMLAAAIVAVIAINGAFSFWQEYRAEETMAALQRLLPHNVRALRDGATVVIPSEDVVPGDVIFLTAGDDVPADGRMIEGFGVRVNNVTVTGEARPVSRDARPSTDTDLLQSRNVLLAGTSVTSGEAKALVFATGMHTAFGRIAHLTQTTADAPSPLQNEIAALSRVIAALAVAIGLAVFVIGRFIGLSTSVSIVFPIGIIVANVPEGLLPTVTLAMAMKIAVALVALVTLSSPVWAQTSSAASSSKSGLMTPQDLTSVPAQAPVERVTYGADANQFAELRVPSGARPHPVVVLVHGGCFKTYGSFADLAAMGDALKGRGIATLNVEYRRIDQAGGGWPNTYLDVGNAVDHVRSLAKAHRLDLSRVVLVGHSAGGHLAMWAAARSRVPRGSALFMANPLTVRGVVNLAGPLDLTANIEGYEGLCRDRVVTNLMGGTPAAVPERYAQASPMKLLPLGVPQVVVLGEYEEYVPRRFAQAYVQAAGRAGDRVRMILIPGAGHFEIASPRAAIWPKVESAIRSLIDGKLPPP